MQIRTWALLCCLWAGACASQATTHEQRAATVATDIERDLDRIEANIAAGNALLEQKSYVQQHPAIRQALQRAQFALDATQLELAAFRKSNDPAHVRNAGTYSSVAHECAAAAARGGS